MLSTTQARLAPGDLIFDTSPAVTVPSGAVHWLPSGVTAQVLFYYVFALFAVAIHAGLGARMVLLNRRVRAVAANRAARLTFAFDSVKSVLIVAALLGVRLSGVG